MKKLKEAVNSGLPVRNSDPLAAGSNTSGRGGSYRVAFWRERGSTQWNVAQQRPQVSISAKSKANRRGLVAAAPQLCRENSDLLRAAIGALLPAKCKGLAIRLARGS